VTATCVHPVALQTSWCTPQGSQCSFKKVVLDAQCSMVINPRSHVLCGGCGLGSDLACTRQPVAVQMHSMLCPFVCSTPATTISLLLLLLCHHICCCRCYPVPAVG
jgi:hypothetical protein